jgi:hypothetical protein
MAMAESPAVATEAFCARPVVAIRPETITVLDNSLSTPRRLVMLCVLIVALLLFRIVHF